MNSKKFYKMLGFGESSSEEASSEEASSEESSSEESSSEESSSEEVYIPRCLNKGIANKILWTNNTQWYTITKEVQIPRPQGNIPMLNNLTIEKQDSLMCAYLSVNGNAVDKVNKEFVPYS